MAQPKQPGVGRAQRAQRAQRQTTSRRPSARVALTEAAASAPAPPGLGLVRPQRHVGCAWAQVRTGTRCSARARVGARAHAAARVHTGAQAHAGTRVRSALETDPAAPTTPSRNVRPATLSNAPPGGALRIRTLQAHTLFYATQYAHARTLPGARVNPGGRVTAHWRRATRRTATRGPGGADTPAG